LVVDKQLTRSLKIKDQFILAQLDTTLSGYRKAISELSDKLKSFSAESLKAHLIGKDIKIDFLKFSDEYITELKSNEATEKTGSNLNTVRNHLIDFNNYDERLPIEFISTDFIARFENFLRHERMMKRKNRLGKTYTKKGKPLPDASIHIYLRDFQSLFSAVIKKYNRPLLELIGIKFNPFEDYSIIPAPEPKKRNLELDQIIKVRDCEIIEGSRAELARNLGRLSFYLCGMNAVDFYKNKYVINRGRLEYCRSKTTGRRKDKAFISIKVTEEAKDLLEFAKSIPSRYSSIGCLNKALSKGMATL